MLFCWPAYWRTAVLFCDYRVLLLGPPRSNASLKATNVTGNSVSYCEPDADPGSCLSSSFKAALEKLAVHTDDITTILLEPSGTIRSMWCGAYANYTSCAREIEEHVPECRMRSSGRDLYYRALDSVMCNDTFEKNRTCLQRIRSDSIFTYCGCALNKLWKGGFSKELVCGNETDICSVFQTMVEFVECPRLTDRVSKDCPLLLGTFQFVDEQLRNFALLANCSVDIPGPGSPSPSPLLVALATILCVGVLLAIALVSHHRLQLRKYNVKYIGDAIAKKTVNNSFETDDRAQVPYKKLPSLVPVNLKIPLNRIHYWSFLNDGNFGMQFRATLIDEKTTKPLNVAVKILKAEARVSHLLREGLIMRHFAHVNVLRLIGISFYKWVPLIVTPLMENGDLLTYVRKPLNVITQRQLLEFALQIADGMSYVHDCGVVHRDLACRNCLLDENLQVKIADFGLARAIDTTGSYLTNQPDAVPIFSTAPEGIYKSLFTMKSDVWSYGVLLWELMSRGEHPYGNVDVDIDYYIRANEADEPEAGSKFIDDLRAGYRLRKTKYCPLMLYTIMGACWSFEQEGRPAFTDLRLSVADVLNCCVDELPEGDDVLEDADALKLFLNQVVPPSPQTFGGENAVKTAYAAQNDREASKTCSFYLSWFTRKKTETRA